MVDGENKDNCLEDFLRILRIFAANKGAEVGGSN
jgi:hypothetical protein